jgi:hypothetical protein
VLASVGSNAPFVGLIGKDDAPATSWTEGALGHHPPAGDPGRGPQQPEHRCAWLDGRIPTAENLALAFWERINSELPDGQLRTLRLWETDKNWAEVGDHA